MKKLIFGYGVTGKSVETYFQKNNIEYLIYDDKPKSGIKSKLLFKYSNIEQIDEVIISPGIKPSNPLLLEIESRGIEVVTDIDIFNKIYSGEIIGITGTNGKTTLVNLLTGYLNLIGKKSIAVGNVGNPPLDIGEQAYDYVVMELSSFQLYYLNNLRLNKAVLMNIFEDHLDWHTSIDEYILTKEKIGKFVKSNEDYIRYNNLEQKTYDLVINDGDIGNISELPFYEDTIHLLIKIV
ncbi:MAG: Mur ligase family protein, partial [Actinomycetota bacterium]|nr:Mur ligase family protein [Actinomycetota bacterium]